MALDEEQRSEQRIGAARPRHRPRHHTSRSYQAPDQAPDPSARHPPGKGCQGVCGLLAHSRLQARERDGCQLACREARTRSPPNEWAPGAGIGAQQPAHMGSRPAGAAADTQGARLSSQQPQYAPSPRPPPPPLPTHTAAAALLAPHAQRGALWLLNTQQLQRTDGGDAQGGHEVLSKLHSTHSTAHGGGSRRAGPGGS